MRRALVSSLLALVILALSLAGCRSHGSSDTAGPGGTSGPGAAGGAGGSAPAVEVSVRETRERTAPERARSLGNVEDTVVDGQTVPVGSGKVDVLICLPPAVSPESLAASVSSVPPAEVFASDSRTLAVSWPGVSLEGMPLPDPAELVANGQAPSGYALVMNLTIDPVKAPVSKDLAGSDGLWTLTIERHRPPDYAVTCPDNPLVRLPYPDPEDPVLHYLSRGEHRLTITFTKPMDRRSVEEVLTGSPTFEVTDLVWTDVHDTGLSYLDNCFPSPDGRHLALVQTDREPESPALTVVIDAATGETVPGYPIPGEAIGWTADGQNLYIVVAAD